MPKDPAPAKPEPADARRTKLAAAMRANLQRRKLQQRAREAEPVGEAEPVEEA